jgi:hypothetical protein
MNNDLRAKGKKRIEKIKGKKKDKSKISYISSPYAGDE